MMDATNINSRIDTFFSKTKEMLGTNSYLELFDGHASFSPGIKTCQLSLLDIVQVMNKLNVTLDSVIEGRVDFGAMVSQHAADEKIPTRYMDKVTLSSRFTGMYMINYISKTFGERSARKILQNFQLKESQFLDSQETNNILLPMDLCDYVYNYHGGEAVSDMGEHSVSLLESTAPGAILARSPNLQYMFELFFEEIAPLYVEKNYSWAIEDSGPHYISISGRPNSQTIDAFNSELLESPSLEYLRKGFLKALPSLLGNFTVYIQNLKSIRRGDDCDMYRLVYNSVPDNHPFYQQ